MIGREVGPYRVVDELGEGGMGVVYRAEDVRLGRTVALKFIGERFVADEVARKRFRREAKTASSLNHPNICTIYDIGDFEGRPFIAMELLVGQTLKALIASRALPTAEIRRIGARVADALTAAHERRIIHRDIKPANVFLVERGLVKVLDFGLARRQIAADEEATNLDPTVTGTPIGTIAYMAPEQALGRPTDHRSDLFSLGVLLYEMANCKRPFKGESAVATLDRLLNLDPPPLTQVAPQHPAELSRIVQRLMAKDPKGRYQAASLVLADLKKVPDQRPAQGPPAPPARPGPPAKLAAGSAPRAALEATLVSGVPPTGQPYGGPPRLADSQTIQFKSGPPPPAPPRASSAARRPSGPTSGLGSESAPSAGGVVSPRPAVRSVASQRPTPARRHWWPVAALVLLGLVAAVWIVRDRVAELTSLLPGLSADPAAGEPTGTPTAAATTGALEVTSTPAGAQVTIGGTLYGVTPLTIPELPVGRHSVRLDSEAGSIERIVQIGAGLTASLDESIYSGWVAIFAPVQLGIFDGGRRVGTTEDGRLMFEPGTHDIELVNERLAYREAITLEVAPGEVTAHSVELPAGRLWATAEPWAEVSVDGEVRGRTPLADLPVTIGTRSIVFKHPELGERRETITVTLAAPSVIYVDFER